MIFAQWGKLDSAVGLKNVDGTLINPAREDGVLTTLPNKVDIQNLHDQLALLLDRLEFGLITDPRKQLFVSLALSGALGTVTTVGSVTTVSSVTTVGSVSNIARIGDIQALRFAEAQLDTAFTLGILNNITF